MLVNSSLGTYSRLVELEAWTATSGPPANVPPTVSLTAPANNAMFAAPATVNLSATAADSDGTVSKVEFYRGATLIATVTAAPYNATDASVAAGNYAYTAKAYDNSGNVTTSAAVNVTVGGAAIYYIYTDQLNTPRAITNAQGSTVWKWDNVDPFGNNAPNENPSGLGNFTCNLRFPGQYFDVETGLHYNYFRDYDPSIGLYIESDPIGLQGGINTYAYANSNPLRFIDPRGLDMVPSRGGPSQVTRPLFPNSPCGKEGGTKFPDQFVGFAFTEACKFHDNCYDGMFGCSVSKATCDFDFFVTMMRACAKTVAYFQANCVVLATSYYAAVQGRDAGIAFDAARAAGSCKNAAACP